MSGSPNPALRIERLSGLAGAVQAPAAVRAGQDDRREGRAFAWLCLAVLVLALAFRLALLPAYSTPDADQTVLGLMARHILHGERPVFYWGQPYTGSLEAYLTAGLFAIFGQADPILHLVPLAASLAFIGLVVALAWRIYGLGVAGLCGIFLALAPMVLIAWGFWAGSGYLEAMALGTAALALALPGRAGRVWIKLPPAFFMLGLALWVQPIAIVYLLAILALLAGPLVAAARQPRRWPGGLALALVCLALFAAGMAPMLQFNIEQHGRTLSFLTDRATAHLDTITVLSRALLWAGPVLLGLLPPSADRLAFLTYLNGHYAQYGMALALVLLLLLRGLALRGCIRARLATLASATPTRDLGLLVVVLATLAGYLATSWGAEQWSATQPRYLLPIYTALPLLVRSALPRHPARGHWLAAYLLVGAIGLAAAFVNSGAASRGDWQPLASLLQSRGITAAYGDYWVVYPLIYRSDERISGVAVLDDLGKGYNRYSPYLRAAAASKRYAWVVQTGSARQRAALACLRLLHSRFVVWHWQDQTIYERPTGRAFPYWNGGRCPIIPA